MLVYISAGFTGGLRSKETACSAGDLGSSPGSRKSPGEQNGYSWQGGQTSQS